MAKNATLSKVFSCRVKSRIETDMYRAEALQREVAKYNESYISKGRALGELGPPDGPTIIDRVSHLITSLQREGNNFR